MSGTWQASVVLIRSSNPAHKTFGTGFSVYCEEQATYIVTCAHVVDDLSGEIGDGGGESNVITAADAKATLIASGFQRDRGIDLAVLRVETLLDRLPLRRASDEEGKPFKTAGFQRPDKDFIKRELKGKFSGQIETGRGAQANFVKAWDLTIADTAHRLQDGYSGSPVIDENGNVVAVVNTREGGGIIGTAISVEALEKIWPEIPDALFAQNRVGPPVRRQPVSVVEPPPGKTRPRFYERKEEQSVPPARPGTLGVPEPTSLAPQESETAPAVLATKRRSSPANTGLVHLLRDPRLLILLALILLGGISYGIYRVVTGSTSGTANFLYDVVWTNSQFVAVGSGGTIHTSPDEHTWTTQHSGTSQDLYGAIWVDSQLVVVGQNGTILTSPDGHTWTTQHSGTSNALSGIAWGDSRFVIVGEQGTILTSPDGHTWATQYSGTSQDLYGAAWADSQFVVVGMQGAILTSSDGRTWMTQHSGTSNALNSLDWLGSQFVVVGDKGTILTSPDGRTWTTQNAGTSNNLFDVAWSRSQFMVVGDKGTILTSPDGRTWTTQLSGTSNALFGIVWAGSQFVIVGDQGAILAGP